MPDSETTQPIPRQPTSRSEPRTKKLVSLVIIVAAVVVCWFLAKDQLSIQSLAGQESRLREFQNQHEWLVLGIAFLVYVVATGLSLPGAAILTLLIGWFFGFWRALIVVSFASTAGATIAFLLSRYFLSDFVQAKFRSHLQKFNSALDREGAFYLFTLRLIPAVPFFIINVVMGLTSIRVKTYWWVSQVGMLAGTCVFVYAGTTIPSLEQIADPALLRVSDISDWSRFQAELSAATSMQAKRLREQLPGAIVSKLDTPGPLSEDDKRFATNLINGLLKQPGFALDAAWQQHGPRRSIGLIEAKSTPADIAASQATQKRLTSINRAVLVYAFPDVVLPPQPILSKELLLAFVLLGVFPIAAKKLLQRFRKPNEPSEPRAN